MHVCEREEEIVLGVFLFLGLEFKSDALSNFALCSTSNRNSRLWWGGEGGEAGRCFVRGAVLVLFS